MYCILLCSMNIVNIPLYLQDFDRRRKVEAKKAAESGVSLQGQIEPSCSKSFGPKAVSIGKCSLRDHNLDLPLGEVFEDESRSKMACIGWFEGAALWSRYQNSYILMVIFHHH